MLEDILLWSPPAEHDQLLDGFCHLPLKIGHVVRFRLRKQEAGAIADQHCVDVVESVVAGARGLA